MSDWIILAFSFVPFVVLVTTWALSRTWSFGFRLIFLTFCVLASLPLATTFIGLYIHPDLFEAPHSPGWGLALFPLFEVWFASICACIAYGLFGIFKRL